jgi:hypothetical protein
MSSNSRRDPGRRCSAATLLVAVSLLSAAPIWHQGHHSLALAIAEDSDEEHELHLCSTGGHAVPSATCPICLSQKMLGQSDTESAAQLSAPAPGGGQQISWLASSAVSVSHDRRARAPPIA